MDSGSRSPSSLSPLRSLSRLSSWRPSSFFLLRLSSTRSWKPRLRGFPSASTRDLDLSSPPTRSGIPRLSWEVRSPLGLRLSLSRIGFVLVPPPRLRGMVKGLSQTSAFVFLHPCFRLTLFVRIGNFFPAQAKAFLAKSSST
jgi:hypothetical protein